MTGQFTTRLKQRGEASGLTSLLFLQSLAAWAFVAAGLVALCDRRALRKAALRSSAGSVSSVTVIVPARNEARNIGAWLRAACRQTHRALRILIADDCSTDATAALGRKVGGGDRRVKVVSFGSPPAGWVGKNWTAYNAALSARSRWLLFSDADIRIRPEALSSALACARELAADAVSLSGTLVCGTWVERQVMPVVAALIFSGIPASLVNDDRSSVGLLAGGFMLVRRDAYLRVGGHRAVRGSIAEDRDLGERLKAFGYRIRLLDGTALISVRMYRGFMEMWEGWRKNFYDGARRNPWLAFIFVSACVFMLVLPVPMLTTLVMLSLERPLNRLQKRLAAAAAICIAANALVRSIRDRSIGFRTDMLSIATTPIGGAFAAAVMVASAWRVQRGLGQSWKGRTIP